MGLDEVRELLFRRAYDAKRIDAFRNPVLSLVPLTKNWRAALVPRGGEQDRDWKAKPLDVSVEMREEFLPLTGRQERIDQNDGVGRLVVHAADSGRRCPAPQAVG